MNRRSLLKVILASLFVMMGYLFISQTKVFAQPAGCGVLAPALGSGDGNYSCLDYGQDYDTCTIVDRSDYAANNDLGEDCINAYGQGDPGEDSTTDSAGLKAHVISNLEYYLGVGGFQAVGAEYIIDNELGGTSTTYPGCNGEPEWQCTLDQQDVTMAIEDYTYSGNNAFNSMYYPPDNNIQSYSDPVTAWSLVIFQNGKVLDEIKLDCGNPIGEINLLNLPDTTDVEIEGTIYNYNKTTEATSNPGNLTVDICTTDDVGRTTVTTDTSGNFYFSVPAGTSFCIKDASQPASTTLEITPNQSPFTNPPPPIDEGSCSGTTTSYLSQTAGDGSGYSAGSCNYHLGDNSGYDIAVVSTSTITTSSSCPDQPTESTDPTISLSPGNAPNAAPSGTTAQSGASTVAGSTYYQENPSGEFDITSAGDQWGTPITQVTVAGESATVPTGYYDTSSFTLNYNNYVNDYPYDLHNTTVNYIEEYNQTIWTTSTSVSYYICNGTESATKTCTSTAPANENCAIKKGVETCTYSCPPGTTKSGESCITTYTGTAYYDWKSSPTQLVPGLSTVTTAPQLGECLARTFTLQTTSAHVQLNSAISNDLPTSVTVSGIVNSTFGLVYAPPPAAVHDQCQVSGITTTYSFYYTTPSNPDPQPLPGGSTLPGPNGYVPGSLSSCGGTTENTNVSSPTLSTGIPPLAYGDTVCATISVTPIGEYMNYLGQVTDSLGNLQPDGNGDPPSTYPEDILTDCTPPIGAEPYFKAIDGDVMAGLDSDYVSACYDTSSGIDSWNEGGTGSIGAGTTAAALATGSVNEFASGQNILSLLDPLTFSNSSTTTGYGGNYVSPLPAGNCGGPDYYTLAKSIPGAVQCPLNPSNQQESLISTQTLPSLAVNGQTINVGGSGVDRYICYSTLPVTIASNITYSLSTTNKSADDLPVFEVVVKGADINIDTPFSQASGAPGSGPVTQLFGNYIAEVSNNEGGTISDTDGGTIDVCSADTPNALNDYNNYCTNDRLVVDGSFTANQIDLYRSYGTLHNANTATTYGTTGGDPNDAEEFDFGPINWLVPGDDTLTIQSITSLPPVL